MGRSASPSPAPFTPRKRSRHRAQQSAGREGAEAGRAVARAGGGVPRTSRATCGCFRAGAIT